jgi:hypothetical protein
MVPNVGGIDRALRLVLGLILLSFVFLLDGPERLVGLIGAVPIATALVGWCPAYRLVGLNTCPGRNGVS